MHENASLAAAWTGLSVDPLAGLSTGMVDEPCGHVRVIAPSLLRATLVTKLLLFDGIQISFFSQQLSGRLRKRGKGPGTQVQHTLVIGTKDTEFRYFLASCCGTI